jgi:hypothetical protein
MTKAEKRLLQRLPDEPPEPGMISQREFTAELVRFAGARLKETPDGKVAMIVSLPKLNADIAIALDAQMPVPPGILPPSAMERYFKLVDLVLDICRFRSELFAVADEDEARAMAYHFIRNALNCMYWVGAPQESLQFYGDDLAGQFQKDWAVARRTTALN